MLACQRVRKLECQIHHHELSMALVRARPSRGYQIHVHYQVRSQQVSGQQLVAMREKLAKHIKGVREKKTKRGKQRTFHRLSPSITSTLAFQPSTTLSPIIRSTRNRKYKGGRRGTTNLNYPKLQHEEENPKNYSKIPPLLL